MAAPTLDEFLARAREVNPGVSDSALTGYWQKNYAAEAPQPQALDLPTLPTFLEAARKANPGVGDDQLTSYWNQKYGSQGALKEEPTTTPSDYAKAGAAGVLSGTGAIFQGAGDLLARGVNAAAGTDLRAANPFQGAIDWLHQSQSTGAKALAQGAMAGPEDSIFDTSTWGNAFGKHPSLRGVVLNGLNTLGQIAPNVALALASGGTSIGAQLAIGATVGGLQGYGGALDEARADILAMTPEQLSEKSELYRTLISKGQTREQAKAAVAEAGAIGAGLGNGVLSGGEQAFENILVGALTRGRLKIAGKGVLGRTAVGATAGGAMGASEEAVETVGQNLGQDIATGMNRDITRGTLQSFVQGMIGEGTPGAAFGALQRAPTPAVEPKPTITDAKTADEAISAFKFEVANAGVANGKIDLSAYRQQYRDHTDEDKEADQANLEGLFEHHLDFGRDDETGLGTLQGKPLKAVAPQDLPTEDDGSGRMTRDQYEAMSALAAAQGQRLVLFDGTTNKMPFAGLANQSAAPGTVFVADNTRQDPATVVFHEIQHMAEGDGDAQANYMKIVDEELSDQALDLARQRHATATGRDLSDDTLRNEIRADIAGDAMADPTFHGRVIDKMRSQLGDQAAQSHAEKFLESIGTLIERVKSFLTGRTFTTGEGERLATAYVKNLERVHEALAVAVADRFIQQGYNPPGAQANASQLILQRALDAQKAKAAAEEIPGFNRSAEQSRAFSAKPITPPPGASNELIRALEAAAKPNAMRSPEERLNIQAILEGTAFAPNDVEGQRPTVNIGLAVGDPKNGGSLTHPEMVKAALMGVGVKVISGEVHQSDTEPTYVAVLDRPLTPEEGHAVSVRLKQEAIVQHANGKGELFGPEKEKWGEFNPDYFITARGRRLSDTSAAPATPVEGKPASAKYAENDMEFVSKGEGSYGVKVGGKEIAAASVAGGGRRNYVSLVKVDEAHRRKGVATFLYNKIEEERGRKLVPSPRYITDNGRAFLTARGVKLPDDISMAPAGARRDKRTGVLLTAEMKAVSTADFLYGDRAPYTDLNGRQGELVEILKDVAEAAGGPRMDSTENRDFVARVIEHEARLALQAGGGHAAIGWYDGQVQAMRNMLSLVHPELVADEDAWFAFTYALAVTSNGTTVNKNVEYALEVYDKYVKSSATGTRRRMPKQGYGVRGNQMIGQFEKFNYAVAQKGGLPAFRDWMLSKHDVSEIKKIQANKEIVGQQLYGGNIIGMKIGGGFLQNLNRNFDALTMDRWFIRTFKRITGIDPLETNRDQKGYGGKFLPKDSLDSGAHRRYARESVQLALNRMQKDFPRLTIADLQAILWYEEKDFYTLNKVNDEKPTDYAIETRGYLTNRGYSEADFARVAARTDGGQPTGRGVPSNNQVERASSGAGAEGFREQPVAASRGEGTEFAPAGVDLTGVHFSGEARSVLDGRKFGTGMDGAEVARVMASTDMRLRERVYSYVNTGSGVHPERYVGSIPHIVTFRNLYDANGNPLDIFGADNNAFESALLDAGYDGYFVRLDNQAVAVAIGQAARTVMAQPQPANYRGRELPAAPPVVYSERAQLQRDVAAVRSLPAGEMDGAELKERLTKTEPALAERLQSFGVLDKIKPEGKYYLSDIAGMLSKPNSESSFAPAAPDTKEFREWFGKSKIVDANGKPLVMYHGTAQDIREFQPRQAKAIFLTADPDFAYGFAINSEDWMVEHVDMFNMTEDDKAQTMRDAREQAAITGYNVKDLYRQMAAERFMPSMANIMPVFVKAVNPFDYNNPQHVAAVAARLRTTNNFMAEDIERLAEGVWHIVEMPVVQRVLKSLGHDGFYVTENGFRNLAVYHSGQIKSATGNSGAFDESEADISMAPNTPEFKRWFNDSKVVDENGKPLAVYHTTTYGGDLRVFDKNEQRNGMAGFGFYFTDRDGANVYAEHSAKYKSQYAFNGAEKAVTTIPVYLKMENPLRARTINQVQREYGSTANFGVSRGVAGISDSAIGAVEKAGYDGIITAEWVREEADGSLTVVTPGAKGAVRHPVYVVFEPTQIKSAIGNSGAFDESEADISMAPADEKIVGASSRPYTAAHRQLFRDVGRTITPKSFAQKLAEFRKDLGKKLAQGLVDQFAPLKDLTTQGYMLARLAKGTSGAFEALLRHGKLALNGGVYDADRTGGFIQKIGVALHGEAEDFLWWIAGGRAALLKTQGRENLFSTQQIATMRTLADGVTNFDYVIQHGPRAGQTTRDRRTVYSDALKTFNEFNRNVLDMAEQSGLIDKETRQIIDNEFYVPFYRITDENGGFAGDKLKNGLVRQEAFKKLKGSEQKLNSDMMANVLQNWSHLIDAAAKNRAAKEVLETAERVGIAVEADARTAASMARSLLSPKSAVWYMDNGTRRHFVVDDPYVLAAITSLDYAGMRNPIMNGLSKFKHWLTIGVTASPAFKVRNLIRDSIQAIASAPLGYNPLANIKQGIKEGEHSTQTYVSALASGGLIRFGTMLEGSMADRTRQLIKAGTKDSTILDSEGKLQAMYDRFIEPAVAAYNELGNRSEEINRIALYKQMIDKGMSHADASLMARDLMDFSMQGAWTTVRFLTQVVPFLNARVQGLYKLGRATGTDVVRVGIVLGAVAAASIALLTAYNDDPDWRKREDWDRDNYWWFKLGGVAFRIPKPFEIGALGTLAERGIEYAFDPEMTGQRFRDRVLSLIGNNLNMNPIPQAFKPLIDIWANKSMFTGRPIESAGMENLRPDYRFTANSSMLSRGISTAGQSVTGLFGGGFLSPVQIDHLIQGYFSWLGGLVVGASDVLVRPLTGEPTRPAPDVWKLATQGILTSLPEEQSRYVSHMYDQANIIEQAYGTYKNLAKQNPQTAAEFLKDNIDTIKQYTKVEGVKREMGRLNERARMIERSNLPAAEKREKMAAVAALKDRLARNVK